MATNRIDGAFFGSPYICLGQETVQLCKNRFNFVFLAHSGTILITCPVCGPVLERSVNSLQRSLSSAYTDLHRHSKLC